MPKDKHSFKPSLQTIGEKELFKSSHMTGIFPDQNKISQVLNLVQKDIPSSHKSANQNLKTNLFLPKNKKVAHHNEIKKEIDNKIKIYMAKHLLCDLGPGINRNNGYFNLYRSSHLTVYNLCEKKNLFAFIERQIFTIELLLEFLNKDESNIWYFQNFLDREENRNTLMNTKHLNSVKELEAIILPKLACCNIL